MMSCGNAPLATVSPSRLRVLMFTGRLHSSEMADDLGRKMPSPLALEKPRVRTLEAACTNPPEWQASYITNNLSVLLVMVLSMSAISRLVRVPLCPPS